MASTAEPSAMTNTTIQTDRPSRGGSEEFRHGEYLLPEAEPQRTRWPRASDHHTPKRVWLGLLGVILTFMAVTTFIAVKTPAYESADEPGHVQNIETLVSGHWYGMNAPCRPNPTIGLLQCSGDEAQQAPLYYLLFAGWQKAINQPALPPFNTRHVSTNPDFLFGTSGVFKSHSAADLRFLLWLRLPNIFLGALTVLITFLAVRLISRDSWTPLVAASFLAFLPRMMFLWPFVTNDNLVNLLGAIFLYVALRYALAPNRGRMAVVGVVYGLLLLTKLSTAPLLLVVVALACFVPGWKRRAELLGVGAASALLVSGWFFIQNSVRYGGPLASGVTSRYLSAIGALGIPAGQRYTVPDPLRFIFIQVPQRIEQTFWYLSDWNQFHWSWAVNLLFTLVLLGTLVGLFRSRVNRRIFAILVVVSIASFLSVWGVALHSYYQARYAFVGIPALAGLVALGVERWKLPTRFLLPAMGLIGTLVAIQVDVVSIHWNY